MQKKTVVIVTGASGRLGRLIANALAQSECTVYAGMRQTGSRNARRVTQLKEQATLYGLDLRPLEIDVGSERSVRQAVARVQAEEDGIDVVVHTAGRAAFGPLEAFTPEQMLGLLETNVVSAHRVNRAVLPHMRSRAQGLLVWVSSSSAVGGAIPYLAPYAAAHAALDTLAAQGARELARWGIETCIVVPGAHAKSAREFAHAEAPEDASLSAEYEQGPYAGFASQVQHALLQLVPGECDLGAVAGAVAAIVETPRGERPFRVHVDPVEDGAEVVHRVMDRVREEMLRRIGLQDLLHGARSPHCAATAR